MITLLKMYYSMRLAKVKLMKGRHLGIAYPVYVTIEVHDSVVTLLND